MASILTTPSDYQSVRRAIDVTLDDGITDDSERILPDAVIADPMYAGMAEAEFFFWVPSASPWPGTLDSSQSVMAKNCVILLTASLVYPAIPAISQEAFGDHRYRREFESVEDVVDRLRGKAILLAEALIGILGLPEFTILTDRFRRAPAWRGR